MTQAEIPEQVLYERAPGKMVTDAWQMAYTDWNPDKEALREALCTLGNGYIATRGAFEEAEANDIHYPGTYLAGGYNRLKTEIAGRVIENEDLVNWPNWLPLSFRHHGGEWLDLDDVDILEFRQSLDVSQGLLDRYIHFKDKEERESTLHTRRFVHMGNQHLAAIEWVLTPQNWSGSIQIKTALDGTVANDGVARYRRLNGRHLHPLETSRLSRDQILLVVEANMSHIRMVQAARTRVFEGDKENTAERETWDRPGWIGQMLEVEASPQAPVRVEKTVSIYTSVDRASSEPVLEARKALARAGDFSSLLDTHEQTLRHLWDCCDLELGNDKQSQLVLRLHIFHLLQTCSVHTIGMDVGIPARGLHGEAYRGHIFWDEMFILPFINFRFPELTRSVLKYRFRRLPEARVAAAEAGYEGAMFPWQSGSNGREETQVLHLNPKSGRWLPDNTHLQRHVNATIAYNIWLYYEATGDAEFLYRFGAQMILEIAKFWVSTTVFNSKRDRYEIHHVVGPDEFHTRYPDSEDPGLNNNAYTNIMAAWVLRRALVLLDELPKSRITQLMIELSISEDDIEVWKTISRKMFVPFHGDRIISQFEGYEKLQEFDWEKYKQKYGDIQRLDRILEAEGDTPNRYKAGKQADVLMLFYLFSLEELESLFKWMGYDFDPETLQRNVQYYVNRTSHGSTLSRVVHSWVLARTDRERSWGLFKQALESDVADIQGGTTSEGIHLGAMAGTVDLVQRGYAGLETRDSVLWFKPHLPEELEHIQMRLYYRRNCIKILITREALTVTLAAGNMPPAKIGLNGKVHSVQPGETREFPV